MKDTNDYKYFYEVPRNGEIQFPILSITLKFIFSQNKFNFIPRRPIYPIGLKRDTGCMNTECKILGRALMNSQLIERSPGTVIKSLFIRSDFQGKAGRNVKQLIAIQR